MRRLWNAIAGLWRRKTLESDMSAELAFHLAMETEELQRRGLSAEDAKRAALLKLGGIEPTKELAREARAYRPAETLLQDLRYGVRALRRSPGYAATAVLALALGIGANTAIFSLVRGILLRPLPYAQADQLLVLHQSTPLDGQSDIGFSVKDLNDFRERTHSFAGLAEYHSMWFNLIGHGQPERVQTGVVSANFFDLLGVQPILGRSFRSADEAHQYNGAPPVLMLSYDYWQNRYGGDPAIIGKVFEMNDHPHTVIGILPALPAFPGKNDVWMPTSACPFRGAARTIETRQARGYLVLARMLPGVTLESARADLVATAVTVAAAFPADYPTASGYTAGAGRVRDELTARARPTLLLLQVTVGLVLLIVCANVANLQLARLTTRREELAVRTALGAGRQRILRQMLTESLLISLLGAGLGVGVGALLLGFLVRFVQRFSDRVGEVHLDGSVLLFTAGLGVLTGLAAGTLPALAAAGKALAGSLSRRDSGKGGPHGLRIRAALSALQVAISFALLIGAGLTLRSVWELQNVDAGFDPHNVLAVHIDLDFSHYTTAELRAHFYDALLERARALPGVNIAAISSTYPLDSAGNNILGVLAKGQPTSFGAVLPQAQFEAASPEFFQTVGVRLLQGRTFTDADRVGAPPVVVINQALAKTLFGEADPIGQQMALGFQPNTWNTVIGVVADARSRSLATAPSGTVWGSTRQLTPLSSTLLIRGHTPPSELLPRVRKAVLAIDPRQPVGRSETLEEARAASLASPRLTTVLLGAFAALALLVTVVGLGGVVAYGVAQRTHEIGIRKALGAPSAQVVRDVAREGLAAVGAGIGMGLLASILVVHLLAGSLFGVTPTDPLTYVAVAGALLLAALAACLIPARRAATLDPVVALRAS
ncbi:MAG: ABC transporter permease [Acidobacteriota bacterium]